MGNAISIASFDDEDNDAVLAQRVYFVTEAIAERIAGMLEQAGCEKVSALVDGKAAVEFGEKHVITVDDGR